MSDGDDIYLSSCFAIVEKSSLGLAILHNLSADHGFLLINLRAHLCLLLPVDSAANESFLYTKALQLTLSPLRTSSESLHTTPHPVGFLGCVCSVRILPVVQCRTDDLCIQLRFSGYLHLIHSFTLEPFALS